MSVKLLGRLYRSNTKYTWNNRPAISAMVQQAVYDPRDQRLETARRCRFALAYRQRRGVGAVQLRTDPQCVVRSINIRVQAAQHDVNGTPDSRSHYEHHYRTNPRSSTWCMITLMVVHTSRLLLGQFGALL